MAIDVTLADGVGENGSAAVTGKEQVKGSNLKGPNGIVAYTEARNTPNLQIKPFINPTYGIDLNQNGEFSGTPDGIHNGTDSVLWTGSIESGGAGAFVFNSTTVAKSGTKSISAAASKKNNVALLTRASGIDLSGYTAISGWIYITSTLESTQTIEFQTRNGGTPIGLSVDVVGRINRFLLNTWQKFSISTIELGASLSTIDEITVTNGPAGVFSYYLDDIQVEETGASLEYAIEPDQNSIYEIKQYSITLIDAYDSTLASSSMPKLPYNTLLALSELTNGISIETRIDGVTAGGGTIKNFADLIELSTIENIQSGGDGTNTWVKLSIKFDIVFRLNAETDDYIKLVVRDDLTPLLRFRFIALGNKYIKETN
jgi:hypothetical protein